ncbi:hypothetical protein HOK00_07725 [bacterium]|nr:hypothetical protein [bacterium]
MENIEIIENLSFEYKFIKEEDPYNLRNSFIIYLIVDNFPYYAFKSISFEFDEEFEKEITLIFNTSEALKMFKLVTSSKDKHFRQIRKFVKQIINPNKEQNTFVRISNNPNISTFNNKELFSKGFYKEF